MADVFTETSRQGYFGRIGSAITGVLFGGILFLVSFGLLWWNEGNAIHTANRLKEGASEVISLAAPTPETANDGKLIHFTGDAIGEKLTDSLLGVTRDAIHLQRVVQMYQWKETEQTQTRKDAVGGGETTEKTYTYDKVWADNLLNSDNFHHPQGHANPRSIRIEGKLETAEQVKVGGFTLGPVFVAKINSYTPVPLATETLSKLPDDVRSDALLTDDVCLVSGVTGTKPDSASPRLGDLKISLREAPSGPVSVIGREAAAAIEPFPAKAGGELAYLYPGTHSAKEMFTSEAKKNSMMTWILRGVGFLIMWIGLMLILNPFKVMADVIGILGDLVGMGLAVAAFLVAAPLTLLTISIAWLAYRPVVGGAMVAGAVILIVLGTKMARGSRAARGPAPTPA